MKSIHTRVSRYSVKTFLFACALVGLFSACPASAAQVYDLTITGGAGGAGLDVSDDADTVRHGNKGVAAAINYTGGGVLDSVIIGKGQGGGSHALRSTGGNGCIPSTGFDGGPSEASRGGDGGQEGALSKSPGKGGIRDEGIFSLGSSQLLVFIGAGGGAGATHSASPGQSGAGGGGGGGLQYTPSTAASLGFRNITLSGGAGGAGGSANIKDVYHGAGGGGGGGGAYMDATQVVDLVVAQAVKLTGGDGGKNGDDTTAFGGAGQGGSGGKALLIAKNLYVVGEEVNNVYVNEVTLTSGKLSASGNSGVGGIAALRVTGDLYAKDLKFNKNSGGIHASIGALNLTNPNSPMTIWLSHDATLWTIYNPDTNADGDSIVIGDLKFAYGNTLSFDTTGSTSHDPVMSLGGGIFVNRNVDRAASYDSEKLASRYDARGKELMFIVGASLKNGDVFLQVQDQGVAGAGGIVVDNASQVRMGTTDSQFLANFGVGDSTTLIESVQGAYTSAKTTDVLVGSSAYRFDVATQAGAKANRNDLVATLRERDTSGGKTYNLSNLSRVVLLDNGQEYQIDILANEQDSLYFQNVQTPPRTVPDGPTFYASGGGGNIKTIPMCSVDLMDYHLHVGAKWHQELGTAKAMFGAFFEAGWGDYDTDDNLPYWGRVRSSGDVRAQGGGVMGTVAFANGFGLDASIKAGHIYSDMHTGSLGLGAKYDYSTYYLGAHLGAFYNIGLTQKSHVRLYGRFMWHFQPSKIFHSEAGEEIKTDLAMSSRLRAGARYVHDIGNGFHAFADAAYEYQADGRAMQRIDGVRAQGLRLNGHYGVFKVGVSWKQRRLEECGKGWDASFSTSYITDRKHGFNFGGHIGYSF